jgi:hypothetical protein
MIQTSETDSQEEKNFDSVKPKRKKSRGIRLNNNEERKKSFNIFLFFEISNHGDE